MSCSGKWRGFRSALWPTDARKWILYRATSTVGTWLGGSMPTNIEIKARVDSIERLRGLAAYLTDEESEQVE